MPETNEKIYICRCEEVTKEEIEQAIKDGATTLSGIKKRTHAGMGLCQGRTCQRLIAGILSKEREMAQILPPTIRPPVRTALIADFIKED
ncbi:MAG: hypothetical protein PWQ67_1041 [Clostridia bacterium]|jgi:NAD(P)H-nitrite reductase large subunit|nr:hypothetical protein [Clostridia bacterium]MDN5322587.1 hypothetical protein [Clostridia bacterium]